MIYIGIDVMCFLALPNDRDKQTKRDFISWADKYINAHESQPYKYRGIDLYANRCAFLHNYSSESDMHTNVRYAEDRLKQFVYSNGGKHIQNDSIQEDLVIIGVKSFINDFIIAVESFLKDIENNEALQEGIEKRLPKILKYVPVAN